MFAPVGGEWLASHAFRFNSGEENSGTNWTGGYVSPSNDLDVVKINFLVLFGLEHRPLSCASLSQALYRLLYRVYICIRLFNFLCTLYKIIEKISYFKEAVRDNHCTIT
jgi:hypothetical protein